MTLKLHTILFGATLAASPIAASAANVGSFDATRTYLSYQLTGANYSVLRTSIEGAGHTVAAATGTITAAYLSGIDVFFSGLFENDGNAGGMATAPEIAALQSFVSAGGIAILLGENSGFVNNVNSWLSPFGVTNTGGGSGGTWAAGPDPLLANGVAGSDLDFNSGSVLTPGGYDVLATISGSAAVGRIAFGAGYVIATGDGNFLDNGIDADNIQFVLNVLDSAGVTPQVPLPAALPMLLAGLGGLALVRRRAA